MSPTFPLTHRPTAYTLIELLAVMFVVAMTGLVEESVARRFGRWTGIGAGAITLIICVMGGGALLSLELETGQKTIAGAEGELSRDIPCDCSSI